MSIVSDGTAQGSAAELDGKNVGAISHASCSVHTYKDGSRMITATVWVPKPCA